VAFGILLVSISKLMEKKVIGANAYTLGEVQGTEADTDKWAGHTSPRKFN